VIGGSYKRGVRSRACIEGIMNPATALGAAPTENLATPLHSNAPFPGMGGWSGSEVRR